MEDDKHKLSFIKIDILKKNNFPYRRTDGQTFEIKQKSKNRLKYSKRVNGKKKFSRFHMIVF